MPWPRLSAPFDAGFADQSQFTKAFQRVTGSTPRAYRAGTHRCNPRTRLRPDTPAAATVSPASAQPSLPGARPRNPPPASL
ncbi:MAG: helix-turn-helix domain-containing protein [Terriglobales bacterium]